MLHFLNRRQALKIGTATCLSGWMTPLARSYAARPEKYRSCILLWMDGGPSTIDLWDLKCGNKNGGPFQEIATSVPGIKISEHLPLLSQHLDKMAIVRSMSTREGDHGRASFLLQTGYTPQGAIQFPAFGASIAHELAADDASIPPFISIAPASRNRTAVGGGFLGPRFNPMLLGQDTIVAVEDSLRMPNTTPHPQVSPSQFQKRMDLLDQMNHSFLKDHSGAIAQSRSDASQAAYRVMQPEVARAFDVTEENDAVRDAYGRSLFGQGCLLARRLVERQVPFVEVVLTGWDTHSNNFVEVANLSQNVDHSFSALLNDLETRGLLDTTLIVWMGEFGRTPTINKNTGRDHWPQTFSAVLAGGGIQGGQTYGKTSVDGTAIVEHPVSVPDFLATICQALQINHQHENMSNVDRPIPIVDRGGTPLAGIAI